MQFLDKLISVISPEAGLRRMRAREILTQFSYDAAMPSRERPQATLSQNASSESPRNARDRVQLIWDARDMMNNAPLVHGIIWKLALYAFGGMSFQSQTGDDALDNEYEKYVNDWMSNCDITGRHSMTDLLPVVFVSMMVDGDVVVVKRVKRGEGVRLQVVEADRLGKVSESSLIENYHSGITVNEETGEPEKFRLYQRTKSGSYIKPVEITADRLLHIFDPQRADQYRGVSHLASVLDIARDYRDIMRYEKTAVKWGSAQTGVVTTQVGSADPWNTEIDTAGKSIESIESGTVHYLNPGETIAPFMAARPGAAWTGFMATLGRDLCAGLKLPYGFFVDQSALGGVTSRLDSQQAKRVCTRYQNLMERKFLRPSITSVLEYGIATGAIRPHPKFSGFRFQFGQHPTADQGNESAAEIEELKIGIGSFSEVLSERGMDWQDHIRQIGREQKFITEIAKENGIDPSLISQRFPNQTAEQEPAAPAAPAAPPVKKKDLSELCDDYLIEFGYNPGQARDSQGRWTTQAATRAHDKTKASAAGWDFPPANGHAAKAVGSSTLAIRAARKGDHFAASAHHADAADHHTRAAEAFSREAHQPAAARAMRSHEKSSAAHASAAAYARHHGQKKHGKNVKALRKEEDERFAKFRMSDSADGFDFGYNPNQARDRDGQWTAMGGGAAPFSRESVRSESAKVGPMHDAIRITVGEGKEKKARLILQGGEHHGKEAPEHIQKHAGKIAPAYAYNIKVSLDPNAETHVTSTIGEKGAKKSQLHPEFNAQNEARKWKRTEHGLERIEGMRKQIQASRKTGDKEEADVAFLMTYQATRPGSESDTKGSKKLWKSGVDKGSFVPVPHTPPEKKKDESNEAHSIRVAKAKEASDKEGVPQYRLHGELIRDKGARLEIQRRIAEGKDLEDGGYWLKSHGATTLEGRHVVTVGKDTHLQFMGKEGVWHDHKIGNPELAKMLNERKAAAGHGGKLFKTNDTKVGEYVGALGSAVFSSKDLRTIRANEIAKKEVGDGRTFKTKAERDAAIMAVSTVVSKTLGNKAQQTFKSYIDPKRWDLFKLEGEK